MCMYIGKNIKKDTLIHLYVYYYVSICIVEKCSLFKFNLFRKFEIVTTKIGSSSCKELKKKIHKL